MEYHLLIIVVMRLLIIVVMRLLQVVNGCATLRNREVIRVKGGGRQGVTDASCHHYKATAGSEQLVSGQHHENHVGRKLRLTDSSSAGLPLHKCNSSSSVGIGPQLGFATAKPQWHFS